MKLNHETPIEDIRDLGNIYLGSTVPEYSWEAASRLKRFLLEDGHQDTDVIPEKDLCTLARQALRGTEPEWTGRNDQDATPLFERFTA